MPARSASRRCRSRSIRAFFSKHNLDVELVNYSGSTDQLLEAIATGKSDAGLGMALRWLKPLEQGFDVKIAAGTHGGCMRVLSRTNSGIDKLADLKGKIVGVGDLGGPDKNFFSVQLFKQGIDPNKDVDWRVYPGNLLQLAVEKGEVQAFLASDPIAYLWLKDSAYKEVASNLDGEYKDTTCCIIGLRGSLVRDEPQVARALTQAVLDAAMFTSQNPDKAAASFQPYAPKTASLQDLQAMVRYHTHHHHPTGDPAQAGAESLCGRSETRFGLQAEHGHGQIRGADLCRRIRSLEPSRCRSRRRRGLPSQDGRCRCLRHFWPTVPRFSRALAWVGFGLVMPVVGGSGGLAANPCARHRRLCHRRRHPGRDARWRLARTFCDGLSAARAMAAGARPVSDPVGGRDRQIRVAAAAVLSAAAGDHRGLYR